MIFNPEDNITVAQGISLLVRTTQISLATISLEKAPRAEDYYTKVKNEVWYAVDFMIAHYNGLDIPADIDPNAPLTKEQFIHYLVQALELTGEYPQIRMLIVIQDEQDIQASYQSTIRRGLLYRIISLDEEGEFHPHSLVTRAEAADVLYNVLAMIDAHKNGG